MANLWESDDELRRDVENCEGLSAEEKTLLLAFLFHGMQENNNPSTESLSVERPKVGPRRRRIM